MTLFPSHLSDKAQSLLELFRRRRWRIVTAESCTGGLIAACLSEIPGASHVLEGGFVTYSNAAKRAQLGVPGALIESLGAVSAEVAEAMAQGALAGSDADVAVSATGIAGPGGGSAAKPVGLVFLGVARRGGPARHERHLFAGDRSAIRIATVDAALSLLRHIAEENAG